MENCPRLVILVGLPGSGKSTWLEDRGIHALSSDGLRLLLLDSVDDQSANRLVFLTLRSLVRVRLQLRKPVTYVDATHLAKWERRPYLKMAELYDCETEALFFDVPLEVCLERNRKRQRQVPEDVLRAMMQRLAPPTREEGFSRVTTVLPEPRRLRASTAEPTTTPGPE